MYEEAFAAAVRAEVARDAAKGRLAEKLPQPAPKPRQDLLAKLHVLPHFQHKSVSA